MRQADISGDSGMVRAQAPAAIAAFTIFVLSVAARACGDLPLGERRSIKEPRPVKLP